MSGLHQGGGREAEEDQLAWHPEDPHVLEHASERRELIAQQVLRHVEEVEPLGEDAAFVQRGPRRLIGLEREQVSAAIAPWVARLRGDPVVPLPRRKARRAPQKHPSVGMVQAAAGRSAATPSTRPPRTSEMCRLYGFRANEPTKVECGLVLAQNSLLAQSRGDARGTTHADGWGIATYGNGTPNVERQATAAFEGLYFSTAAERVFARTVVAHVRNATVGETVPANTHPFSHGRWVFAHNGTVREFERVEPLLAAEIAPRLRPHRRGSSDSEAIFYWLLTRLADAGVDGNGADADSLADVFGSSLQVVERLCREAGADRPSRLNWILTDGDLLLASRWHSDLHWLERRGVHDCEICGIPHAAKASMDDYRAVVIASEPISDEDWIPVPEASLVMVDGSVEPTIHPL